MAPLIYTKHILLYETTYLSLVLWMIPLVQVHSSTRFDAKWPELPRFDAKWPEHL